jgi:hypothetical protein
MARVVISVALTLGLIALAQNGPGMQPRPGAATSQNISATLPSGTPLPSLAPCPSCSPPNYGGQSKSVPGAVNLTGCQGYHVCVYAASTCTLDGGGTEVISYWPVGTPPSLAVGTWPQNNGLTETHTIANSANLASMCFPGHVSDGIGWIAVTPTGVTQSDGGTTVTTLIEGSKCGS